MPSHNFHTTSILSLIVLISNIPQSFSQSKTSPQNIQTFYPLSPPPPLLPPSPAPPSPDLPPPPPLRSSAWPAVGKAIAATATTTLVISGLLFFLLLLYSRRRRRDRDNGIATIPDGARITANPSQPADNFTSFGGNLKGVIVDENGLDVLYWRNLQEADQNTSNFKKQTYKSQKDHDQKNEHKRMVSGRDQRLSSKNLPIQQIPLLRGKSSTSQNPVWGQKQDQIAMQKPPSVPSRMPSIVEVNQDSSLQLPKQAPPLPKKPSLRLSNGTSSATDSPTPPPRTIPRAKSQFEGDLMEALFGYVATKRKSPSRDKPGYPSPIFILDTCKSQYTTTVIKSLRISREEIINALNEGHGLNADTLEKLANIAPSKEEASRILLFNGDPIRLADAESFLYHLLKAVPSAFVRFNAMHFRSKYSLEVSRVNEDLESLESACKELRAPGLFPKLLEAVLKAGNRLRRNAEVFDITALKKLSNVRSSDRRTTLLQFVVQEVVRAEGKRCVRNRDHAISEDNDRERKYMMLGLPMISGLSAEFPNVKKAAALDCDVLAKTGSMLAARLVEIQQTLAQCGPEGAFARVMKGFLDNSELEMKVLMEDQARVIELAKKTRDYYPCRSLNRKAEKDNPLRLFVIMTDFMQMVDQVCADIAMDVDRRRTAASVPGLGLGSVASPPESPRVFRFPKLQENFMSGDSGESEDDDSSEIRNDVMN